MTVRVNIQSPIRRFTDSRRNVGFWVDDEGRFQSYRVTANDRAVVAFDEEADPFPDERLRAIAIRQYGMVRVENAGQRLRVEWDLRQANPRAIVAARRWLSAADPAGPVELSFFYAAWARETYQTATEAARRIEVLCGYRNEAPPSMIACEEHSDDDMPGALPLLTAARERWAASQDGRLEQPDSAFQDVAPYAQMFTESGPGRNLVYRSVGPRAHILSYLGREWGKEVVGRLVSHGYEDVEFESVVSAPYFETLRGSKPHYGHVRAIFAVEGKEPEWVSYQRLIVPYNASNGARGIAIVVAPDQNVSIPFLPSR